MLVGNTAFSPGAYEQISTTILGSASNTITFSSIPQTYIHLQLRIVTRNQFGEAWLTFNGDSGANYVFHSLWGNGSGVASDANTGFSNANIFNVPTTAATTNNFGAGTVDLLQYTNTSINKTFRAFGGFRDSGGDIRLRSGLWRSTAAISTIAIASSGSGFVSGSRFSLYGIVG
jgi:hypothetical protein